jgi:dimethylamine monooxygenase subunit A
VNTAVTSGFSVADLAPFRGGRGALRLGLSVLPEAVWRDNGPGLAARAAAKAAIFDATPESLIVQPEAALAIAELAALLGTAPSLRDAALAAYEDLLILLPDAARSHVLVAGALAFPTDWHLAAKIGKPLAAVHAPIPTYAEKLSASVDHVFATLGADRLLIRCNWNVLETDTLRYLPDRPAIARFGHVTAANAGETLFARVERQALRRLPASGAAVFTIGVYVEPLRALPAPLVADLARAVASVPHDEAVRRGAPAYLDALASYAEKRVETEPPAGRG